MTPDPTWLGALKLPTKAMLGLLLASATLLALDSWSMIQLAEFGAQAKQGVVIVAVVSGALSVTGIGAFLMEQWLAARRQSLLATRREIRAQERREALEKEETAALERINHLSPEELRYLANCLRDGSQSFYACAHSPPVATLIGKGLVYTPGGAYHREHYPYTIEDFAWKALLERRKEILARDEEYRKSEREAKRRERF